MTRFGRRRRNKIERIYIVSFRGDVRRTRCCVASIRRWYPDIPISLIKDRRAGAFDTGDLERYWDVDVRHTEMPHLGFGMGTLEPLFQSRRERCLILDSDVVFLGRVIDELERWNDDFIVDGTELPPDNIHAFFLDVAALSALDPDFHFPGFVFNTGQLVATTGILSRKDFEPYVRFGNPVPVLRRDVFKAGEQGILNYVLLRKAQQGKVTLRRVPIMRWPGLMSRREVDVRKLGHDSPYPFVLHWSGPKNGLFTFEPMGYVLKHFEAAYYARLPHGRTIRLGRRVANLAAVLLRRRPWKGYLYHDPSMLLRGDLTEIDVSSLESARQLKKV